MRFQVRDFMTRAPITIDGDQSLVSAQRLMREHRIRHLPVLSAGKLVGLLSFSDLRLMESIQDTRIEDVTVAEAMTPAPFTVSPTTAVRRAAETMVEHKYGSAVVVDRGHVVGIFTTIDALNALIRITREGAATVTTRPRERRPS
jgi:acetoin utilization protein AcuB